MSGPGPVSVVVLLGLTRILTTRKQYYYYSKVFVCLRHYGPRFLRPVTPARHLGLDP